LRAFLLISALISGLISAQFEIAGKTAMRRCRSTAALRISELISHTNY